VPRREHLDRPGRLRGDGDPVDVAGGSRHGARPRRAARRTDHASRGRGRQEGRLMTESATAPIDVLLVEDDPGDVLMTREAFEENKVAIRLAVVSDGVAAMAYLRREGEYADVPRPDLVLLDLNLPRMDGREVLAAMKSDADLRHIPVVVLT